MRNVYITGYKKTEYGWLLLFEDGQPAELKIAESKELFILGQLLSALLNIRIYHQ